MLVKICGITRREDAEFAAVQGAGALGFVFWPDSPRFIDPYRARKIVAALSPFVTPVGVFVNQPAEYVNAVAALVGLGVVQLHGDESMAYAAAIGRPILKSVAIDNDAALADVDRWPGRVMPLVDVYDPVRRGGTGGTVDWARAAALAVRRPMLLAGGLTPENVTQAIAEVRPFGIDVSSGVESAPGVKNHARVRALFEVLTAEHERQKA